MGKAQELLYYTRVFARVKPEGKVSSFGYVCGELELHVFFELRISMLRASFPFLTCAASL